MALEYTVPEIVMNLVTKLNVLPNLTADIPSFPYSYVGMRMDSCYCSYYFSREGTRYAFPRWSDGKEGA